MRKKPGVIILCLGGLMIMSGCVSQEKGGGTGLYKNSALQRICHQSYDRAMELVKTEFQDIWVETAYGRTHGIVAGAPDAPPLVLLPGLFADATMWYANLGSLAEHHRVYALDMINYGGKSQPSEMKITSPEDYSRWYAQVMAGLGLKKAPLAGLSYGSWTALTVAGLRPDLVSALLLLDPSESFMPMDGGIAWKGFWAFMFFPDRAKYTGFFQWLGGGYTDPDMEIWFSHLLDVIEHGTATMASMPRKLYAPEDLKNVTMPVLVMAGGKPILYKDPQAFSRAVKNALPQAEVDIVPDTGHGLNMEKAEYVNRRMSDFFKASGV